MAYFNADCGCGRRPGEDPAEKRPDRDWDYVTMPTPDNGYDDGCDRPSRMTFAEGVRDAYKDESKAVDFYARLAEMAPNESIRRSIMNIRRDEMRHRDFFECLMSMMERHM